ncbi:MAG: DEAD/DEAH box helicase [Nitrospiraceae bacterium]|nr:DEAD/DEAH box helicase [Nitrospiraceae bacterium]
MEDTISELLELKGYKSLRPPQKKAVEQGLLENTRNYIIIAPTSTGKTFTAELAMYKTLKSGGRVLYLVPSKALVTEKINDFKYLEEKKDYYVTDTRGDGAWDTAHILVTTFERFFFETLKNPIRTQGFNLAIIDEFHVLYDKFRGFILEKSLILSKEFDLRLICLSATFEDKEEVAEWLGNAVLVTIPEDDREIKLEEEVIPVYNIPNNKRQQELYRYLIELRNHPYLIFCNNKPNCLSRAKGMKEYIRTHHPEIISELNDEYKLESIQDEMKSVVGRELTENEELLSGCLSHKVGFHNAFLDTDIRTYVEGRVNDNKINWLFATTTLAFGFNSPTKSVVVNDLRLGRDNLPVYVYIQMIGRAGRPQYHDTGEKVGFAYVVANSTANETLIRNNYFGKELEKASSHIAVDDYFQKAILELIYAERGKPEQIISFFENSFNTFQTNKNPFGTYNLSDKIKGHITWLIDNGFLTDEGVRYKLTSLGDITVEFLMGTYRPYPLTTFKRVEDYIEEHGLDPTFDMLYMLTKTLGEATETGIGLYKKPRVVSEEVEEFFARKGVADIENGEYAAYAIWNGWMKNKTLKEIENVCKVYVDPIKSVVGELVNALNLVVNMWKAKGKNVPQEFEDFKIRVKKGVRGKEVSVARHRGYGRELTKDLYVSAFAIMSAIQGTMATPTDITDSSLMEFYKRLYETKGRKEAERYLIANSRNFREKRAESFFDIVEKELKKETA